MDIELVTKLRELERHKQTPEIIAIRRELADKIIAIEVAEQKDRLWEALAAERELRKQAWDAKWDAGIVEEVLRVQQQLQENEDGRYKIISIG